MSATFDAKFDDGKEDGALRTIGEVCKALGIKAHVLRYWEQQFPMLNPLKRSGGRRYYRATDVAMVEQIDRLVNREGYTLKGAQQALQPSKGAAQPSAKQPVAPQIQPRNPSSGQTAVSQNDVVTADVIAKIRSIRTKLAAALDA